MKEHRETALDAEAGYQTTVKIKWVMKNGCPLFNVHNAVINLFNKMGQINPSIYVQLSATNDIWKTLVDIPAGSAFTTTFDIKQDTPLKSPSCVKAFATISTKLYLNTIKFDNKFWRYLQKNSVYVKPDMVKRNDVVSTGILVNIHPTLMYKDDLLNQTKERLKKCCILNTKVCNTWICKNAQAHKPEEIAPLPEFWIIMANAKWGNRE
eukprot:15346520-Ditylum_brightwellii.AAC.1